MTSETPTRSANLTLIETLLLFGVFGGIGYAINGWNGVGVGTALATVVIAQDVWRAIRVAAVVDDDSGKQVDSGSGP